MESEIEAVPCLCNWTIFLQPSTEWDYEVTDYGYIYVEDFLWHVEFPSSSSACASNWYHNMIVPYELFCFMCCTWSPCNRNKGCLILPNMKLWKVQAKENHRLVIPFTFTIFFSLLLILYYNQKLKHFVYFALNKLRAFTFNQNANIENSGYNNFSLAHWISTKYRVAVWHPLKSFITPLMGLMRPILQSCKMVSLHFPQSFTFPFHKIPQIF